MYGAHFPLSIDERAGFRPAARLFLNKVYKGGANAACEQHTGIDKFAHGDRIVKAVDDADAAGRLVQLLQALRDRRQKLL